MIKNNLKQILDERGLKYIFVAKNIGMSKGTFSNLLNNKYSTSLDYVFKICRLLNLKVEDIFYEVED